MWLLQSCSTLGSYYALLPGKEYVVGRRDCEIIIENDRSISRKHAVLKLIKLVDAENLVPFQLKLVDCSKYGTSVNGAKVTSDCTLNNGDTIMFGILGSQWRVKLNHVIVTTSCLRSVSERKAVQKAIEILGGRCVPEWNKHCTHLIMENLIMTIKAVCALVSAKPIVTPSYLQSLLESIKERRQLPDTMRYIPPLKEETLQKEDLKFHPCEERKTLFKGKIFYFLSSKQLVKLKMAVELGGGLTTLLTSQPEENLILSQHSVVINYPSSEPSQNKEALLSRSIIQILKRNFKRAIPESEIGLAVAFNSISKFCNPDFSDESSLLNPFEMASQLGTLSNTQILAPDSQLGVSQNNYTEDRTQKCSFDDDIELIESKTSLKNFQTCQSLDQLCKIETVQQVQVPAREEKKRLRNESAEEDNFQLGKKIKTERNDKTFTDGRLAVNSFGSQSVGNAINVELKESSISIIKNDQHTISTDQDKSQADKTSGKITDPLISSGIKQEKMDCDDDNFHEGIKHEVVIEVTSLIKRIPTRLQTIEPTDDVPNFKKFKKVFNYSSTRTSVIHLREYEGATEDNEFCIPQSPQVNDQQQESQENPFA